MSVNAFGPVRSPWAEHSSDDWGLRLGVPSFEWHASLPSTNMRLRSLARDGCPLFTTVVAEEQTLGIGRAGKRWHSPAGGGLWMSVLLPGPSEESYGALAIGVGVAAARAIEGVAGVSVDLKWPNDLLIGSKKVAGVLCQVSGGAANRVVAGVGVNLRPVESDPPGLPHELAEAIGYLEPIAGAPVSESDLAATLIGEMRRWASSSNSVLTDALRSEWDSRDCLRGRRVRIEGGLRGVACGLMSDGALSVACGDEPLVTIRSGSVRLDEMGRSPALYPSDSTLSPANPAPSPANHVVDSRRTK